MSEVRARDERLDFVALGIIAGTLLFLVLVLLLKLPFPPSYAGPVPPADEVPTVIAPSAGEARAAESTYLAKCAGCHQASGLGIAGAFPPLAKSAWVTADAETPIRIALLGLQGAIEVEGQHYENVMPGLGLSDSEVAQAVTHIRTSWGNGASAVREDQVAHVRSSLGGRTDSWRASELNALRSK